MNQTIPYRAKRRDRQGAAVVEFAVCLPVLMLLILGSIEATSAVFLKQALTTSAYEGVRAAIRSGSTTAQATQRANDVLSVRQVRNATVTFVPANVAAAARGQRITVEVSAPVSSNSPFIGRVIADQVVRVRSVMVKE